MDDMQGYDSWTDPTQDDETALGDDALGEMDPLAPIDPSDPLAGGTLDAIVQEPLPQGTDGLPAEIEVGEPKFGAQLGPYGSTADSQAEDYYWSTTEQAYLGAETGREIDEWTDTAK